MKIEKAEERPDECSELQRTRQYPAFCFGGSHVTPSGHQNFAPAVRRKTFLIAPPPCPHQQRASSLSARPLLSADIESGAAHKTFFFLSGRVVIPRGVMSSAGRKEAGGGEQRCTRKRSGRKNRRGGGGGGVLWKGQSRSEQKAEGGHTKEENG